jgi:hypothetical protein
MGPRGTESNNEQREQRGAVPGGRYPSAMVWFNRRQAKSSGNDFLRGTFEICGGPLKGRRYYAMLSCDITRAGTMKRWEVLMESCGVTEEFEIGSNHEGNAREGDRNIRSRFLGRPFVAIVKRERDGNYENNDIESLVFPNRWTDEEREQMAEWAHAYQCEQEKKGYNRNRSPEASAQRPEDDGGEFTGEGEDRYDSFEDAGQYGDTEFDDSGDSPPPPDEF